MANLGPVLFHMNFSISLLIAMENPIVILVGNMNLPIDLEVISSFIILSSFIQRLSVSVHVSRILFMFLITNFWFPLQISYIFFIPFVAFILRNPVTFVVLKNEIFNFYLVSNYFYRYSINFNYGSISGSNAKYF